jgi:hypothetical protein
LSSSICTGPSWKRKRASARKKRKHAGGQRKEPRSLRSNLSSHSRCRSDRLSGKTKSPAPRSRRGVFLRPAPPRELLFLGRSGADKRRNAHAGGHDHRVAVPLLGEAQQRLVGLVPKVLARRIAAELLRIRAGLGSPRLVDCTLLVHTHTRCDLVPLLSHVVENLLWILTRPQAAKATM